MALESAFKALQLEAQKEKEPTKKVEKRAASSTYKGVEFTAYQGIVRTNDAKTFCAATGLKQTAQFDVSSFGERNAY
eukprot:4776031-Amphidinium_carterae.1